MMAPVSAVRKPTRCIPPSVVKMLLAKEKTISWLLWNSVGPKELRFDSFPAFVLWLFISNMIQIMLIPLIMIGQNLQGRHAEARAEADFEVNTKSEREIEAILMHLENQNSQILRILQLLEESGKRAA